MKFACKTASERLEELKLERGSWHNYFAWLPVRLKRGDCRWLETIERRGVFRSVWGEGRWEWEYRSLKGRAS